MSACLVLLVVLGCAGDPASPGDRWIAEDKAQHFTLSFSATLLGYGSARMVLDREPALAAAGAAALTLGVAKEISDARAGGAFSGRDLTWNVAGIVLALTLAHRIR